MSKRINSHDVARKAGVSQSTVSLVLNGRMNARISQQTRERVIEAARQLNYSLNTSARALVTGKTHRISIVLNEPGNFRTHNSFFVDILAGVVDAAVETRYNIVFLCASYPDWRSLFDEIRGGSSDGVLLIGRYSDDPLTLALLDALFPTVCVSYSPNHCYFHSVDCDNELGGRLAAQHLIDLGHRNIAYIHPEESLSWVIERKQGIIKTLQMNDIPEETLVCSSSPYLINDQEQSYKELMRVIDSAPVKPTALIFADEWRAQWMIEKMGEEGIRIPGDFSVVNFNSTILSERAYPPITSVWQPLTEIGKAAFRLLIDILDEMDVPSRTIRYPVRLDVRESTAPLERSSVK